PRAVVGRLARRATAGAGDGQGAGGSAAMYGMMEALPDRSTLTDAVLDIVEQFTTPQDRPADGEAP
ncbi:MAG TPA: hypothetical protein VGE07_07355, partial [Herpetosiphonaceae bacterium]